MDLLPPLRDPRHLQPLRGRLDGRDPRVRRAGREAHQRDLREAGHRPRAAQPARRPGLLDDVQAGRAAPRGPGHHPVPLPPARLQRQPLLRSAVQDPEVPAGLPRPVRLDRGRPGALPGILSLVQQRPSSRRARPAHRRRRPPRPRPSRPGPARPRPGRRLPGPPRTLRSQAAGPARPARHILDQPAPREGTRHSVKAAQRCPVQVDRFRSGVQQSRRARAILSSHRHTHLAAPLEGEQGRAASLQLGGQPGSVDRLRTLNLRRSSQPQANRWRSQSVVDCRQPR